MYIYKGTLCRVSFVWEGASCPPPPNNLNFTTNLSYFKICHPHVRITTSTPPFKNFLMNPQLVSNRHDNLASILYWTKVFITHSISPLQCDAVITQTGGTVGQLRRQRVGLHTAISTTIGKQGLYHSNIVHLQNKAT